LYNTYWYGSNIAYDDYKNNIVSLNENIVDKVITYEEAIQISCKYRDNYINIMKKLILLLKNNI